MLDAVQQYRHAQLLPQQYYLLKNPIKKYRTLNVMSTLELHSILPLYYPN